MLDSADVTAASLRPQAQPTVAAGVLSPPPSGPQAQTAIHFSGAFSLTLQPGADFGPRYRIESLLGEGGMGTVYKATDKELGRTVALKLVRPEYAALPAAMARFRQELLLASKISHKNILRIHDLGDAGGIKFISMAYVEGQDLGKIIEQGRLPLDRMLHFTRQLCSALDAAHSEEVVHRDLKPNNILVDKTDTVFVMDFGLAKSFETDATMMTRTGQILGTPRYMAPEQVEAKPVDHRTDIYSLGMILYEMVSGDIPFKAESAMQLMYQRVTQKPKDVKLANPEVPDYLAGIIMRCLEKEPEARYQGAKEVLADLEAQTKPAANAAATMVSPAGTAPAVGAETISIQIPKPTRRGAALVAAALLLILGAVFAIPGSRHWILGPRGQTAGTAAPAGVQHYLAVLPFRVIGDAAQTQYLADGIVDSLSAKLTGLRNMYVASNNAVTAAMPKTDPAKIARTLGVTLLVRGTVQTSADKIAVDVSLDDVGNGSRSLFHREFQGVRADLLTLEDSLFNGLVNALAIKQSNEELARSSLHPTENIGAYDLYLKGQNLLRSTQNPAGLQNAANLFEQATRIDARFALAYTGVADAYLRLWDKTKDTVWTQKASGAARQEQALNDSLPEVHFVMGSIDTATGRANEAIAELERALQISPHSDEALRRLGSAYLAAGRQPEAIAAYTKATETNPYYWQNFNALGTAYFRLGKNEQALQSFRRVTELEPDRAAGFANLGVIYYQQSKWNEAIPMFQKAIALQPTPNYYSNLGTTYFFTGRYQDAAPMFEKAVAMSPNDVLFRWNLADAYRWSGQKDKALASYDKAIELAYQTYRVNPRDAENLGYLAICYAKKGDDAQARQFLERALALDPKNNRLIYDGAIVHALAGRNREALASLSLALRNGYSLQEATNDPELKSVRALPEFAQTVRELPAAPR